MLVIETADLLGGTTAVSGGAVWLPNYHRIGEATDSPAPTSNETARASTSVPERSKIADLDRCPLRIRHQTNSRRVAVDAAD